MNEESSSSGAEESTSKATATAAARAILARRSNEQIPLSLGKASLRLRLEAYYSLISPETLSNRTVWLRKYDQIYEKVSPRREKNTKLRFCIVVAATTSATTNRDLTKPSSHPQYGGTHPGERKLATKLAKKYGTTVRLLLAASARKPAGDVDPGGDNASPGNTGGGTHDESWYRLRPREIGSGVVEFSSPDFDPLAALTRASETDVFRANPWMTEVGGGAGTILDNVGKCATLLPQSDPLYRDDHLRSKLKKAAASISGTIGRLPLSLSSSSNNDDEKTMGTKKRSRNNGDNTHPFEVIASYLESGPHSVLFRCREERKRVTVVVRYVNMVRGTLSGTLIAFDKHMNMILRDVEEVYSPRLVDDDEEHKRSNLELELERRRRIRIGGDQSSSSPPSSVATGGRWQQQQQQKQPGTWNVRRRQMKQLMLRGDMVVSIYASMNENYRVSRSRYHKRKGENPARNRGNDRNDCKATEARRT